MSVIFRQSVSLWKEQTVVKKKEQREFYGSKKQGRAGWRKYIIGNFLRRILLTDELHVANPILDKIIFPHLGIEFLLYCASERLITVFTRAHHLFIS